MCHRLISLFSLVVWWSYSLNVHWPDQGWLYQTIPGLTQYSEHPTSRLGLGGDSVETDKVFPQYCLDLGRQPLQDIIIFLRYSFSRKKNKLSNKVSDHSE